MDGRECRESRETCSRSTDVRGGTIEGQPWRAVGELNQMRRIASQNLGEIA